MLTKDKTIQRTRQCTYLSIFSHTIRALLSAAAMILTKLIIWCFTTKALFKTLVVAV